MDDIDNLLPAPEEDISSEDNEIVNSLALGFIEDEVGRFDYVNNWKQMKTQAHALVRAWLMRQNLTDRNLVGQVISRVDEIVKDGKKWIG